MPSLHLEHAAPRTPSRDTRPGLSTRSARLMGLGLTARISLEEGWHEPRRVLAARAEADGDDRSAPPAEPVDRTDAGGRTRRGGTDVARVERPRPTAAGSRGRPDGRHPQVPVTPRAARRRRDHHRRPGSIVRCPRGPGSFRGSARAYVRRSQAPAGVRDLSDGGVVRPAGAHALTCRLLGSFAVPEEESCGDLPGLRPQRRSLVAAHGFCDSLRRHY